MAEYLAPGVYIEEVSYRPKSIEGVSTSTAGFVGPTRYGPTQGEPTLVTGFVEYERVFGGLEDLELDGATVPNFTAHAVRAFFSEGGRRLYVSRIYRPSGTADGRASQVVGSSLTFRARFPGRAGNLGLAFRLRRGRNVLAAADGTPRVLGLQDNDTVWITTGGGGQPYRAERVVGDPQWRFHAADASTLDLSALSASDSVRVCSLDVEVRHPGRRRDIETFTRVDTWDELTFDNRRRRSLGRVFAAAFSDRGEELAAPMIVEALDGLRGPEVLVALFGTVTSDDDTVSRSEIVQLEGGVDGDPPEPVDYSGSGAVPENATGLSALEHVSDISIVAAPAVAGIQDEPQLLQATGAVIEHCERMRYRVAVLDIPNVDPSGAQNFRARFDTKHAAMYYPWLQIVSPTTGEPMHVPPGGFVAGIYARNDVERGVHKAPANEVVRSAVGLRVSLNKAHQDILNPLGVNCIRFFEGRGIRIWGARTATSDSEWRYINLRRYFAYLERSIDVGSQWAVFEPNGEKLWSTVRQTVEDFLLNEWQNGRLLGIKPDQAFFVRCDRQTMTQNDLDSGRLVCEVGVSPLRPAEFVIFRIGQWTASRSQ